MNQEKFMNDGPPRPPINSFSNQKQTLITQRDYCELPRNDPAFIMSRRSSAGPIPFGACNESLINDQPMIGRHNTIGNCNYSSTNEFANIDEHSQEHSEMTDQKQTYECDACGKRLCSIRSLKRHKNTCKRVKAEHKNGPDATNIDKPSEANTLNKPSKSKNVQIVSNLTESKEDNANNKISRNYQQYYQTSSNKIDQFNNAQILIDNKINSGTNFFDKNSGKSNNKIEDDKVSNIVDSVVAKIRSQSNFTKLSITNHASIQSSSYQSIPPQQKQTSTQQFGQMNAATFINPQFAYNNDSDILTKFQHPPKSAPVITTASTQQFWPVMGTRLIQPQQMNDANCNNTAFPAPQKFEYHHQINKCDYSYSMPQYPGAAKALDDPMMNYNNNNKQMPTTTTQPTQQINIKSASDKMEIANLTNESNTKQMTPSTKIVYRYLCPECNKPYSCRKNVKRHRISQHKVPQQEAQDGFIKRVILPPEQQQNEQKKNNNKMEQHSGTETKIEPIVEPPKREQIQTIPTKNEPTFQQQYSLNVEQQSVNNTVNYPLQQSRGPPYSAPLPNQPQQPFFTYPGQYGNGNNRQYNNNYSQIEQSHPPQDNQAVSHQYYSQQQYHQQQHYYNLPPQSQIQSPIHIPPYNNYHQQKDIQQSNNQQSYPSMGGQSSNIFYGSSHHQIQQQPSTSSNFYANYQQQHLPQNHHQYRQQQPTNDNIYSRGPLEQGNASVGNYSDSFDYWEQIKSMDFETTSDSDAIEMAKILEDLKRTEEVTEKRQQMTNELNISSADTTNSGIAGIQRKSVELAEADTTFSPPQQADDSGIQNSQQIFSQFMSRNHQIPESPYVLPSQQTIFHFNVKTELNQESGINFQQKDNQIVGETSGNDAKTTNKKNKQTKNRDNNFGTRKKKNAKGTQSDENVKKRKKPEELSNVDPDSTMSENPLEEADQSNISSNPAASGIYQTNYLMFNTNVGSIFQR